MGLAGGGSRASYSDDVVDSLIPVEAHLQRCLSLVAPLPPRRVPVLQALGAVLAEDVDATLTLPSFVNASMDGYAVVAADVASASHGAPVVLPVHGDVAAGLTVARTLARGTTVRIMTGAPMPLPPEGVEPQQLAVVPVEWTDGGLDRVSITRAPDPGAYLRWPGEDVREGDRLLTAGTRLTSRRLGLLAALGHADVLVHPAPRLLVVSTGSELVAPGQPLGFGQIYESNGVALTAAGLEAGADAVHAGSVPDDEDGVIAALRAAAEQADLVVTSGGVSAGAYDVVKAGLLRMGGVRFDKVAMQPGMPQGAGVLAGVPIVTLPGNPVSSTVSFEVFVRPMIGVLSGRGPISLPRRVATVGTAWRSPVGKRQFARAVLDGDTVHPVGGQGSHLVADLAQATCLAVVPEPVGDVEVGMTLDCLLLQPESA